MQPRRAPAAPPQAGAVSRGQPAGICTLSSPVCANSGPQIMRSMRITSTRGGTAAGHQPVASARSGSGPSGGMFSSRSDCGTDSEMPAARSRLRISNSRSLRVFAAMRGLPT